MKKKEEERHSEGESGRWGKEKGIVKVVIVYIVIVTVYTVIVTVYIVTFKKLDEGSTND